MSAISAPLEDTEERNLKDFRQAAAEFVNECICPNADVWEQQREVPRSLFEEAGRRGLFGLKYEGRFGGSARPYAYTYVYLDELGRSGAWGTILSLVIQSEMATPMLHLYGSESLKSRFLEPAIRGDSILALALTEPEGGSDVARLRTTASPTGEGYVVNGKKFMIGNGSKADAVCVIASLPRRGASWMPRLVALIIPRETPGFRVLRRLDKIGLHATDNCELEFDECFVPAENVVGLAGRAGSQLTRVSAFERLALATCSVGAMQRVWQEAVEHARVREVFGAPMLQHQIWRHRFSRGLTSIEAARLMVEAAAQAMDEDQPDLRSVTMAKLLATETLQDVVQTASQSYGARGFLQDELPGRAFVDARALTIGGGTSEALTELLADLVL